MSTYRVTIRRDFEEVDISADDVAEALALTREYYPSCQIVAIENEHGEAEVVKGVCVHCGVAVTEGEDLVEMDDRAYCLKCARRLAG